MKNIFKIKEALDNNDLGFLKKIVNKSNVNSKFIDESNDSLILYAVSYSNDVICDFLENIGANMLDTNDFGETIIHSAVYYGESQRVKKYLEKFKDLLNKLDNENTSPLYLALTLNKFELFNIFLELGGEINEINENWTAPIHFCCINGNYEILLQLIEKGANVFLRTQNGNLPIALSVNNGHLKIFRYLYDKYYKIDPENN